MEFILGHFPAGPSVESSMVILLHVGWRTTWQQASRPSGA